MQGTQKKKQKLSTAFEAIKVHDLSQKRWGSSEESDLCVSSSDTLSLDGEAIESSCLQTVNTTNAVKTDAAALPSRRRGPRPSIEDDEAMEDDGHRSGTFAKLLNIDKVNKSFGLKRKRRISDDEEEIFPYENMRVDDDCIEPYRPSAVSWADSSGYPLCRTIENSTELNSLTLDSVLRQQYSDLLAAMDASTYCPIHSNSPQIYQCGSCWDRVKLCIYCFSEKHVGHFLQLADKHCVPLKIGPAFALGTNESERLWQKEDLYQDCSAHVKLVHVGSMEESDNESLDVESSPQSYERDSTLLTSNESEVSDESESFQVQLNRIIESVEPTQCNEDSWTLEDTLNVAWQSELIEEAEQSKKKEVPASRLHPSWLRGAQKALKSKSAVTKTAAHKPVEKGIAIMPAGRPPRQEQPSVLISTMHKLRPAQTIVKVDQTTNNAINVVAVGRRKGQAGSS